jgi:hypothetical protein
VGAVLPRSFPVVATLAVQGFLTKGENEFASLPTEFAMVGKLSWRRNSGQQWKLRPKKN